MEERGACERITGSWRDEWYLRGPLGYGLGDGGAGTGGLGEGDRRNVLVGRWERSQGEHNWDVGTEVNQKVKALLRRGREGRVGAVSWCDCDRGRLML